MANSFLWDTLGEILDATVQAFNEASVTLPTRQFVSAGPPAFDCEQVTVDEVRMASGLPGREETTFQNAARPNYALADIYIVRCMPGAVQTGVPASNDLAAIAETLYIDQWVLRTGLSLLYHRKPRDFLTECQALTFGETVTVGPSGGYVATRQRVNVQIT